MTVTRERGEVGGGRCRNPSETPERHDVAPDGVLLYSTLLAPLHRLSPTGSAQARPGRTGSTNPSTWKRPALHVTRPEAPPPYTRARPQPNPQCLYYSFLPSFLCSNETVRMIRRSHCALGVPGTFSISLVCSLWRSQGESVPGCRRG